jgi:hypothetical protein
MSDVTERAQEQLAKQSFAVGDCIEWCGYKIPKGYGRLTVMGIRDMAHRWAWKIHFGEIPNGLFVMRQSSLH